MAFLLQTLSAKEEVDEIIRETEDKLVVLRFGREADLACMQLDNVVSALVGVCDVLVVVVSTSSLEPYLS